MRLFQGLTNHVSGQILRTQIQQQQMRVGSARNQINPAFLQCLAQNFGIFHHLRGISLKRRTQGLTETNRLGRNHMHQRPALRPGKNGGINLSGNLGIIGQNHSPARPSQRLMSRSRHHIGIFQRIRMHPAGHQPGKMRHIHHQICPDLIGNLTKALKINLSRISRPSGNNQLWLILARQPFHLFIINQPAVPTHTIGHRIKPLSRKRNLCPVGQMTAGIQRHSQNRIMRLQQRHIHSGIGLRTGMWLHIDKPGVKQFLRPLNGQIFHHVHKLAAAIITPPRITFGILIGQDRPLRLQHRRRNNIFRGNQFNLVLLALQLVFNCGKNLSIFILQIFSEIHH